MSKITWTNVGLINLSFLLPPLAVFIKAEEFNKGGLRGVCAANCCATVKSATGFRSTFAGASWPVLIS